MFQCGHCLSSVTCNSINGSCPDGCMSGWQATDKCDKRMQILRYDLLLIIQLICDHKIGKNTRKFYDN